MAEYFAFKRHITEDCDQKCEHCYIFAENADKVLFSMLRKYMLAAFEHGRIM